MFENSDLKEPRPLLMFWLKIILVVAAALAVVNFFRVNPPPDRAIDTPHIVEDTKGVVVKDVVEVAPGSIVSYRLSFPYRSRLKGSFRVREKGTRVLVMVTDETNLSRSPDAIDFSSIVSTGSVPKGVINTTLEAGTYFLVIDNRASIETALVDADFLVE